MHIWGGTGCTFGEVQGAHLGRYRVHVWGGTGAHLGRYRCTFGEVQVHIWGGTGAHLGRYRCTFGEAPWQTQPTFNHGRQFVKIVVLDSFQEVIVHIVVEEEVEVTVTVRRVNGEQ